MSDTVLQEVRKAADKMGSCDPLWLREKKPPDFHTVEEGDSGPPVVMLHGLFGAMSNWDSTLPLMGEFCKAIALHFPLLTSHRSEVKVKALAAFTEYFVRSRTLSPVTLCGNSLGGHVALRAALATPEVVDCLLLSGASGLYEHSPDTLPIRPDNKFIREQMGRVFKNEKFITEEAISEIVGILSVRMNHLNLIHVARSAKKDNLEDVLKEIKTPTLLLWGEDDEVTTMNVAETFHKNLPNSKLVTIKNCGHAPMIEHPEWFAEEAKKFLQEHSHFKDQLSG